MIFRVVAVQPGQRVVDTPEAQVGAEQRESDRRLAQQRVEQRGIRRVQLGYARLRHGQYQCSPRITVLTAGTGASRTDLPSAAPSCSLVAHKVPTALDAVTASEGRARATAVSSIVPGRPPARRLFAAVIQTSVPHSRHRCGQVTIPGACGGEMTNRTHRARASPECASFRAAGATRRFCPKLQWALHRSVASTCTDLRGYQGESAEPTTQSISRRRQRPGTHRGIRRAPQRSLRGAAPCRA